MAFRWPPGGMGHPTLSFHFLFILFRHFQPDSCHQRLVTPLRRIFLRHGGNPAQGVYRTGSPAHTNIVKGKIYFIWGHRYLPHTVGAGKKLRLGAAIGAALLVILWLLAFRAAARQDRPGQAAGGSPALSWSLAGRVVVVDPGHGGPDPGTVSPTGQREKDLALAIARELTAQLARAGARAVLTRDGDHYLSDPTATLLSGKRNDLAHRLRIAEQVKADILVSIHLNSFPATGEYGAQTFCQRGRPESLRLARCIQSEINRILANSGREALEGDFYLTRGARMPSVIVEAGFLSNVNEARLLSDPVYQAKVAFAIGSGIARYFAGDSGEKPPGSQVGAGKIGVGKAVDDHPLA